MSAEPVPAPLTADEILLLSDRCVAELLDLEHRIAQQQAVVRDAGRGQRWRAGRVLRSLQARAAGHRRALEVLRAGGPRCVRCDRALSFAVLLARPEADACDACRAWQEVPYDEHAGRGPAAVRR